MEKKRKLLESETVDSVNQNVKKKKKDVKQNENDDSTNDQESFIVGSTQEVKGHELEENRDVGSKKKRKKNLNRNESEDTTNQNGEGNSSQEILESTNSEETYNCAKNNSETSEPDGDAIHTKNPTWKKPSRNSGETKKQYKRRMRALREAGLLLDPPVVEGVKKEKRTRRKTRREKKMAKEQKNEELDKFRSIVQINYLKTWKTDPSKWKFNKNVQGKIVKHMFDASRIPQDVFEILIEYITGTEKLTKMHEDINKKCSQIVETMEKWTAADEAEKKKLTEPDQQVYERARQLLQSLA